MTTKRELKKRLEALEESQSTTIQEAMWNALIEYHEDD